jgi:hypothetical protein
MTAAVESMIQDQYVSIMFKLKVDVNVSDVKAYLSQFYTTLAILPLCIVLIEGILIEVQANEFLSNLFNVLLY